VRALARELGIASADRPDSQEMCFIPPNGSYIDVLDALAGDRLGGPGAIVDTAGRMLGEHRGIYRFTIGQRRGLNLPGARPFYVTAIDAANNTIVVGGQDDLVRRGITLRNTIWHDDELPTRFDAEVQVRYRHHPQPATVQRGVGGSATVEFPNGVMAPATGQAAVCYRGELVLGGGWIDSTE
jgi:tRNA-specific 2-thiouridylase